MAATTKFAHPEWLRPVPFARISLTSATLRNGQGRVGNVVDVTTLGHQESPTGQAPARARASTAFASLSQIITTRTTRTAQDGVLALTTLYSSRTRRNQAL